MKSHLNNVLEELPDILEKEHAVKVLDVDLFKETQNRGWLQTSSYTSLLHRLSAPHTVMVSFNYITNYATRKSRRKPFGSHLVVHAPAHYHIMRLCAEDEECLFGQAKAIAQNTTANHNIFKQRRYVSATHLVVHLYTWTIIHWTKNGHLAGKPTKISLTRTWWQRTNSGYAFLDTIMHGHHYYTSEIQTYKTFRFSMEYKCFPPHSMTAMVIIVVAV